MKYFKNSILVIVLICYACAKSSDNSKTVTNSEILLEEAPIELLENYNNVIIDEKNKSIDISINHTLIQQKLNEIIELQQLGLQDSKFKTEIEQQLLKLTKGKIVFDSIYLNEKISSVNYLSSPLQLNDSTKTIDLSFNLGSNKHKLTAMIISSKKIIDGNTYTSQEVSFMTME